MSEKILERVRKMLALANDQAASEGERDNALRMAHNTLAKHQLDMMDVQDHIRDKDDPRGKFELDGWGIPWCRSIRASVARLFNCEYFYMKMNATRCRHSFVGRESNATTAMLLGDWIVLALLREADKRYGHRLTPEGRSFGEGCAAVLRARVSVLLREKENEYLPSYGVALLNEQKLNEAFITEHVGALTVEKSRNTGVVGSAYSSGVAHGKTINLNTQLANKKGTRLLK